MLYKYGVLPVLEQLVVELVRMDLDTAACHIEAACLSVELKAKSLTGGV